MTPKTLHPAGRAMHPSSEELVALWMELPAALANATKACDGVVEESRPMAWAMAVLAFLLDPESDARVWFIARPPRFWYSCGFTERPQFERFARVHASLVVDSGFVFAARAVAAVLQGFVGGQVADGGER